MREVRDLVDRRRSSRRDERIEEKERSNIQHLAVEERGVGFIKTRGYDGAKLQTFPLFNDQELPLRDNAMASKFQWKNLLKESGNSMFDGEERGFQGSGYANCGRKHEGFVKKLTPIRSEMIRNSPPHAYNIGTAECRGVSRIVTGGSVEDPDYHGRVRNVIGLPAEDAAYYRHTRNITGLPIENADYNGRTRKKTGFPVEVAEYHEHSRNLMTDLPVEYAEYHRRSRTMRNVLPVKDADYRRPTRSVTGPYVEDGGRFCAREYPQHMDREFSMKSYAEDNRYRFRNEDSSHSLTPRSQSIGQHTSIRGDPFINSEVFHHPVDGLGIRGSISPSNCYNSHGVIYSKADTDAHVVSNEVDSCLRAKYNPNTGRHVEYPHLQSQRSEKVYKRDLSEDIYEKYEDLQDYHDHGDPSGNDTLDPSLERHGYVGNSREYALHRYGHNQQEEPMADIDDISRTGHRNMQTMNMCFDGGEKAGDEIWLREEELCYDIDAHGVSPEDDTWTYPTSVEGAFIVDEDAQQKSRCPDCDDHRTSMPKRKRRLIGKTSLPKRRTSTLGGRGALSYDNRHLSAEPEKELIYLNRSSSSHFNSKANAGMSKTGPKKPFGGLSKELQSRLSKPRESGRSSVKDRLDPHFVSRFYGPQASKHLVRNANGRVKSSLNVNHANSAPLPYGKAEHTSAKKRLKASPHMDVCLPVPQASHLGLNLESQQNSPSKTSNTTKEAGVLQEPEPDPSILKVKPTEKDPPDNSEELKRLVDQWFSKCMLYLNSNLGRHKRFKEQGNAGTLKCIICSSSKEFVQTKDVAIHAFTSLKVGFRAPHLGFHRALCVLMGWDPAVSSNGRWICKSLPDVDARALKEDLILWPPVVIVHNGSAGDFYNNELVKISVGQLENTLKDMGLSEGKTTICHGKSGNPNIMLVKFTGTLSGLQEAERLDKIFTEKKRGRADLQEVIAGVGCSEKVAQEGETKIEETLYGYLGIADDFDKLNYEMRRRCVGKSKKEIFANTTT